MQYNVVESCSQFYTVIIPDNYRLYIPFARLKIVYRSPTNDFRVDVLSWLPCTRPMDESSTNKLRHIEPNLNLQVSLLLLRYIGNWSPSGRFRSLYFLYTFLYFTFVLAIYLFVQVAYMIVSWGDIERMIAGSFLLMTNTGNCYKMIVILIRQKRIQRLLDCVESDIFSGDNIKHERILTRYTWHGIFHHIAYQSLGGVSILCWALASIADIASGRERRLPVESWYPFDIQKSPFFEIACAQQIVGELILCFHNIAMDTLVTNFINVACCQLDILKQNIEAIGRDDDHEISSVGNDEACRKLNYCVEHSKAIINFESEIQDIFGASILYQCFVNCAIICLTAFHISRMDDYTSAELMGTALYLCGMTYQIFIYCWHGNELSLHSQRVALAAYFGNWWKFNERYKSTLRIVIIRSHRPLILKVGGIMTLSLETFTSILRMSYSLFTVLQSSTTT